MLPGTRRYLPHNEHRWFYVRVRGPVRRRRKWRWPAAGGHSPRGTPFSRRIKSGSVRDIADEPTLLTENDPGGPDVTRPRNAERPSRAFGALRHPGRHLVKFIAWLPVDKAFTWGAAGFVIGVVADDFSSLFTSQAWGLGTGFILATFAQYLIRYGERYWTKRDWVTPSRAAILMIYVLLLNAGAPVVALRTFILPSQDRSVPPWSQFGSWAASWALWAGGITIIAYTLLAERRPDKRLRWFREPSAPASAATPVMGDSSSLSSDQTTTLPEKPSPQRTSWDP